MARVIRNPGVGRGKQLHGQSDSATRRAVYYADARKIRELLKPQRTQEEVANELGISRQAVELCELSALAKIAHAFRKERAE